MPDKKPIEGGEVYTRNLVRDCRARDVKVRQVGEGEYRLKFTISQAKPIDRGIFFEGLDHSPRALRMDRFEANAVPLLFNHNWDDVRGMVISGQVIDEERIEVEARLFDTQNGRDARAMVEGGMHNVSFGYDVYAYREESDGKTLTAIDWEPFEVSLAPVPADISVGISREKREHFSPVRLVRAEQETANAASNERGHDMPNEQHENAAKPSADTKVEITRQEQPKVDFVKAERERGEAIKKFCRLNKIDEGAAAHWIEAGYSYDQVADEMLKILQERGNSATAPAMLGLSKKEVREYSVIRAITAAHSQNWQRAGLELEVHQSMMQRDNLQPRSNNSVFVPLDVQVRKHAMRQARDFNVAGAGNMVGTEHMGDSFIELLRNRSVVMAMGATRLSGMQGNVAIPKMTAGTSAYWLASETTAITETQPTIGQLALSPKNVAALTEVSHQMLQQSDPSADQLILTDLAAAVAVAADAGAINGDGTGGAPTGILNTAGIGSDAGTTLDYAGVLAGHKAVFDATEMQLGGAGSICDSATTIKLMTRPTFSGGETPIWQGNIQSGQNAGLPARTTGQIGADTLLFGAWSSLIVAEWGVLELAINPHSNFAQGLTGMRAWYTMDVGLRYAGAFHETHTIT